MINYNPEKSLEFLSDYSPSIVELNPKESSIKTETGTLIKINNIKEKMKSASLIALLLISSTQGIKFFDIPTEENA